MGIRGAKAFCRPMGEVKKCDINAPESRFVISYNIWIGPFPKDVMKMVENDDVDFGKINFKGWTQQMCQTYITNQLKNTDKSSFELYGPQEGRKARREAMQLMKKEKINVDAEVVEGVSSLLFQRVWAVILNKQGWMGNEGM